MSDRYRESFSMTVPGTGLPIEPSKSLPESRPWSFAIKLVIRQPKD